MNDPTNRPFVERRSAWSFPVTGGKWTWTVVRPDKSVTTTESTFDSLTECIADAMRFGYVPLKPAVERRERRGRAGDEDGEDGTT
jgi:hypothetical protein